MGRTGRRLTGKSTLPRSARLCAQHALAAENETLPIGNNDCAKDDQCNSCYGFFHFHGSPFRVFGHETLTKISNLQSFLHFKISLD